MVKRFKAWWGQLNPQDRADYISIAFIAVAAPVLLVLVYLSWL